MREELVRTDIYQESSKLVHSLTRYIDFLNKGPSAQKVFKNIHLLETLEEQLESVSKIVEAQRKAVTRASISPPLLGMPDNDD